MRANWNLQGFWTRQETIEKESPGWPTSIAHLGCLQKSVLTLFNLARIAFNYTGYETKWCLWSTRNQNAGTDYRNLQIDTPHHHFTLGEIVRLQRKVTTNVTQSICCQTWVSDSLLFHQAACQHIGWNIQSNVLNSMAHLPNILQILLKKDALRVRVVSIIVVSGLKPLHPVHVTGACLWYCIHSNVQIL